MQYALALCGALALSACSSKYAMVPARMDLAPYGRVALVTFSAEQSNRAMSTLATQRFAEALLANQSGVELLEVPATDSSFKGNPDTDAAALALALGKERDVPAVFVGLSGSHAARQCRIRKPCSGRPQSQPHAPDTIRTLITTSCSDPASTGCYEGA
jgi:hypothetical protein